MRPQLQRLIVGFSTVLCTGLLVTTSVQGSAPQVPGKPTTATPANSPLVESEDYFENEYLRVYFNQQGQFIITAREGAAAEIPLLYPKQIHDPKAWSSYATVRYRYLNTPADRRKRGEWHKLHTTESIGVEHRYIDKTGDRALIVYSIPLADETIDADGADLSNPLPMCGMYMKQSLSFMTNPYTGRQDMVRIRFTLEHGTAYSLRRCSTENNTLGDVEFGLRVLLDTQIGVADSVRVLTSQSGDSIPSALHMFESPELTAETRQVMLDLTSVRMAAQRTDGPLVTVSAGEWGKFHYDQWSDYPGSDLYSDSAVAIRWDGMVDPWSEVFEFGYGLAPAGGGESWVDAPVVLQQTNTLSAHAFAANPRTATKLLNGTVTLALPQGMAVPVASAYSTNDEGDTWEAPLGDLDPGHTRQAAWDIAITGPPGRYVYTTTTRFEGRPVSIVNNAVELKQSFGFTRSQAFAPEGNPGSGPGSHTVEVVVSRFNSDGRAASVTFATAPDAGNANAALANSDYLPATELLTFQSDEITKTVSITILDDSEAEPNESIVLTLGKPSNNATVADQGKVLLTIVDNDEAIYTSFLNLPAVVRQ